MELKSRIVCDLVCLLLLYCKNKLDVAVGAKSFVAMYILVQDAEYLYHGQKMTIRQSFSKIVMQTLSCRRFILLLNCLP